MPDVFTKANRSEVMSRIRSRGNRDTELALAKLLRRQGITGWRRHQMLRFNVQRPAPNVERSKLSVGRWKFSLSVRPDFVFPALRVAVFVDGCFWHACPRHATRPRYHASFWRTKFAANRARDRLVNRSLRARGWRVLRIWEHELARTHEARLTARLQRALDPLS